MQHSEQEARLCTGREPTTVDRLAWTLQHAVASVTATSFTTIAAFAANMVSRITPVRLFGLFMVILVFVNYIFALSLMLALVVIQAGKQPGSETPVATGSGSCAPVGQSIRNCGSTRGFLAAVARMLSGNGGLKKAQLRGKDGTEMVPLADGAGSGELLVQPASGSTQVSDLEGAVANQAYPLGGHCRDEGGEARDLIVQQDPGGQGVGDIRPGELTVCTAAKHLSGHAHHGDSHNPRIWPSEQAVCAAHTHPENTDLLGACTRQSSTDDGMDLSRRRWRRCCGCLTDGGRLVPAHLWLGGPFADFVYSGRWVVVLLAVAAVALFAWRASLLTLPSSRPTVWRMGSNIHKYFDLVCHPLVSGPCVKRFVQ
jgi:hypothetical protein